jgi:hypothetical protein
MLNVIILRDIMSKFIKLIDGKYHCNAPSAKAQKLCPHHVMEMWEVFCQWCDNDICGIGKWIADNPKIQATKKSA